jgi:hypothetical protein
MANLTVLLTVLFTGLKLADIIDWSWCLVTLPLYGGFAVWLLGLVILNILVRNKVG